MRIRLALGVLLPVLGAAQPGLSLREAVDRALATHPMLTVYEPRVAISEGARLQAGLGPNPEAGPPKREHCATAPNEETCCTDLSADRRHDWD